MLRIRVNRFPELYYFNTLNDTADEKVLYHFYSFIKVIYQGLIKALPNNEIKTFYQFLPSELIFKTIKFSEDIKPLESDLKIF